MAPCCQGLSPPGIPTGFCHKARGCAAEALPREDGQGHHNPEAGCAEGSNRWDVIFFG